MAFPVTFGSSRAARLVLGMLVITVPAWSQLPQTRLSVVFPPGGQRGTDVTVTINGELAENATELVFSHPGITATQQLEPASEYRVPHRRAKTFNVQISPEVLDGRYEVRALGPTGLSNARLFAVTGLKELRFAAAKNGRDHPFEMAIDQVATAQARADQRDYYQFDARRGEAVFVQVLAERIDSQMDAGLAIYDASGQRLARCVQGKTKDPLVTFTPPTDGSYLVEVWDTTFRGGEQYPYRLEISDRPYADAIFPPVAQAGVEAEFTVYGYNLPGATPVSESARAGNLQQRQVRFVPEQDADWTLADGLPRAEICSAHLHGLTIRLPKELYRANPIFLGRADGKLTTEAENDSPEHAQEISPPCEIVGQFYPQHDVDWYEFQAQRGDSFWIEVTSQRFGSTSDVAMRVRQKKNGEDGQVTYRELSTTDDIEGPPNSRSSRRFHSGSNDAAYRLRVDEDGTYQVSVRDLYNTTWDDPRLVYQLAIEQQSPDYQLAAFPAPDRHGDEKIVKPCGVSILPGGTSTVFVRVLPRHGFRAPVEVTARNLPRGVTAHPLLLRRGELEGQLVLQAAWDARPSVAPIRITGTARVGADSIERVARTGVIRRDVANVDRDATDVRLSRDLTVAVVDSTPAPVSIVSDTAVVTTCVGAKVAVPVRLERRDGFSAEVQLAPFSPPKGIKVGTVKTTTDVAEVPITIEDAKVSTGMYSLLLNTKIKEKRPRNMFVVNEAEKDLDKVQSLLTKRDAALATAQAQVTGLSDRVTATEQLAAVAKAEAENARTAYAKALQAEQQAATDLSDSLAGALASVTGTNASSTSVSAAESRLETLRQARVTAQKAWRTTRAPVAEATSTLAQEQVALQQAQEAHKALQAKRDEAEQKRQETEKRLGEVSKAQLDQDHEFWVYSSPVRIKVQATPLSLQLNQDPIELPIGQEVTVPVRVLRQFGFQDQVSLAIKLPEDSRLSSSPLVIGGGQESARVVLRAADDAQPGRHDGTLELALRFNGVAMAESRDVPINVIEKKEEQAEAAGSP